MRPVFSASSLSHDAARAKAAGKVFEVEPAEAVDVIIEKLKEKFII